MPRPSGGDRLAARKARRERHAAETDPDVVMNAAARFLEARQRSVAEVRKHLAESSYPAELVERTIERLLELRWLDDEVFARSWVESRDRAHPRGRDALRRELTLKGIDRTLVAQVLDERAEGRTEDASEGFAEAEEGSADVRAAARLLARKRPTLERVADVRQRRQRAYALLARNGFDAEVCREAIAAYVREADAAEDGGDED